MANIETNQTSPYEKKRVLRFDLPDPMERGCDSEWIITGATDQTLWIDGVEPTCVLTMTRSSGSELWRLNREIPGERVPDLPGGPSGAAIERALEEFINANPIPLEWLTDDPI